MSKSLDINEAHNASEVLKSKGRRRIVIGLVWLLGGIIVLLIQYASVESGGTIFIFWGAMLFGVILLIIGLVDKSKSKNLAVSITSSNDLAKKVMTAWKIYKEINSFEEIEREEMQKHAEKRKMGGGMGQEKFWQNLYPERKILKKEEKISSMPPEKVKMRFSNLLEQALKYENQRMLKKGMLIYAAADESFRKELNEISETIQKRYFG